MTAAPKTPDSDPAARPADAPPPPRWFRRHPRLTLFLFTLTLVLALLWVADWIVGIRSAGRADGKIPVSNRAIRLKEHKPLMDVTDTPTEAYLAGCDSLARKPYRFRADADAFVMPSRVHQTPDATVVFLGGSTTECIYVTEEVRFPYLAGRLMEQKTGLKINACNGGVSGNHSMHSNDILLNKVIGLRPDVVVMMHNVNDLVTLLYMDTYWNDHNSRSLITTGPSPEDRRALNQKLRCMGYDACDALWPNLTRRVETLSAQAGGWDEWHQVRGKKILYDEAALASQFETSLRTFIALCRLHRIRPVLMTMASRFTDKPEPLVLQHMGKLFGSSLTYEQFKAGFDRFNRVIRQTAQAEKVPVIDLAAQVPQDKKYMYDPVHLNDEGSRLVAEIIAREMELK